jgi:CheY-like chemotaxis protein
MADPGQLEQVVFNLAVNSRDAMPHGGTLTLETQNYEVQPNDPQAPSFVATGDYIALTVTDTGSGMSEETLAQVFDPFYTTKEVGKGTGLGLATAYGIVNQSGGYIWAKSRMGEGTTFTVLLPRVDIPVDVDVTRNLEAFPHGTETILLVEDEELVREMIRETLKECGYHLLEAKNGEEALDLIRDHDGLIDLVLTDVVMPGSVSGPLLAEQLAGWRPLAKVLFMSGYTEDAMIQRGVRTDTLNFIQKPFQPKALTERLHDILHPARMRVSE